jgi:myo-inositol 2-dehydrogenase/D-chiro-inositol 1-dehydrogenase
MNCKWTTNFEDTLADPKVDAVIVASPTDAHFDQITKSLNAGKAVFTEKPLGDSLKQVDECFALAEEKNLPFFVGFNRRFDKSHAGVARGVKNGDIGVP